MNCYVRTLPRGQLIKNTTNTLQEPSVQSASAIASLKGKRNMIITHAKITWIF